jgi:hypothetical protein
MESEMKESHKRKRNLAFVQIAAKWALADAFFAWVLLKASSNRLPASPLVLTKKGFGT